MSDHEQRMLVFVGSYAEASDNGVYVYEFDEHLGELKQLDQAAGLKNPTFLHVDDSHHLLYAIAERIDDNGAKVSDVVTYLVDPVEGKLTVSGREYALNGPACHIQRSRDDRYLTLTSYHNGTISLVKLTGEGQVDRLLDIQQHEGKSVHPNQDRPHPHSSFFSPDGRYLFVCDLGIDRIRSYEIDRSAGKLIPHSETVLHPGAGPRHMTFHPNGRLAYVINELDSTVTAYTYDADKGTLAEVETVSTLPEHVTCDNSCAEIAISANGKFLYGSNRGHDSIVVYAVDGDTGKLTVVDHVPVEGAHPRHFSILPGGQYLIAANRDTNNLVVFKIDQATGKLDFTGHTVEVSKPVCVWGYRF